jgi:hypothetical protein
VVRHVGQFSVAYLTELAIPSCPWLKRKGWLCSEIALAAPVIAQLSDSTVPPPVRPSRTPDIVEGLLRLWAQREQLLDALDRMPQTPRHGDVFRCNPFARRVPGRVQQTVATDWTGVGVGQLGGPPLSCRRDAHLA